MLLDEEQVSPLPQVPQLSVVPQPLSMEPQVAPSWAQVLGVHVATHWYEVLQLCPDAQVPQDRGEPQPLSGVPHWAPSWLQFFFEHGGAASTGELAATRQSTAMFAIATTPPASRTRRWRRCSHVGCPIETSSAAETRHSRPYEAQEIRIQGCIQIACDGNAHDDSVNRR